MRAAARQGKESRQFFELLNSVRAEPVEASSFSKEVEPLAIAALRVDKLRANGNLYNPC